MLSSTKRDSMMEQMKVSIVHFYNDQLKGNKTTQNKFPPEIFHSFLKSKNSLETLGMWDIGKPSYRIENLLHVRYLWLMILKLFLCLSLMSTKIWKRDFFNAFILKGFPLLICCQQKRSCTVSMLLLDKREVQLHSW
jgi:hypothetical protein